MSRAEKIAGVALVMILHTLFMAFLGWVNTGDKVDSGAVALVYIPFALGPILIASYRPQFSRTRFWITAFVSIVSPWLVLLYSIALLIAAWPTRRSQAQVELIRELPSHTAKITPVSLHAPLLKPRTPKPKPDKRFSAVITPIYVEWVRYLSSGGASDAEVGNELGIAASTVRKILRGRYD